MAQKHRLLNTLISFVILLGIVLLGSASFSYAQQEIPLYRLDEAPAQEDTTQLFKKAKVLYYQKEYKASQDMLDQIFSIDPEHKGARRYSAYIEKKLKVAELKEARANEKETIEKRYQEEKIEEEIKISVGKERKKRAQLIYEDAKQSYKQENYDAAELKFEEVLKLNPEHKGAQGYLRDIARKMRLEKWPGERVRKEIKEEPRRKARKKVAKKAKRKPTKKLKRKPKKKPEKKEEEIITRIKAPPGKLTVEECVEIGVNNYLPLEISEKQIKLAKVKIIEATRNLFPTLSLTLDDATGKEPSGSDYESRKYGAEGSQAIYHGGELWHILKQAKLNLAITEENERRLKSEVISSVRKAFYSLVKAKETVGQQDELLKEVEKVFDSVNNQYKQGVCSELDFLDVQAKHSQVYFQTMSSVEDEQLANLILKQAMNIDPDEAIDIEYTFEFQKIDIKLRECLNLAYMNRSEVRINELVSEFTVYSKKIAKAKGLPRLDVDAYYGKGGEAYKEDDNLSMEDEWFIIGKMSIPFGGSTLNYSYTTEESAPSLSSFEGTETQVHSFKLGVLDDLRYFSNKREADIEYIQATNELEKIKKEVMLQVKEAFVDYTKALIQIDAAKNKLRFQSKEAEILKIRRGFDEATDSKVVEALINRTQEQFSYVQAVANYYSAIADINKAIGIDDHFKL